MDKCFKYMVKWLSFGVFILLGMRFFSSIEYIYFGLGTPNMIYFKMGAYFVIACYCLYCGFKNGYFWADKDRRIIKFLRGNSEA